MSDGFQFDTVTIKKESPNEGTETPHDLYRIVRDPFIKKESPNEGAEKTMME